MSAVAHLILEESGDCGFTGKPVEDVTFHADGSSPDSCDAPADSCDAPADYEARSTVGRLTHLCAEHAAHVRSCSDCIPWLDAIWALP